MIEQIGCSLAAGAVVFVVEQAGGRLRGRGRGWGYLAIHRPAVVDRLRCVVVAQRRSALIEYGQCSP